MKSEKLDFTGKWDIFEMSNWDEAYFNEDGQAYIKINKNEYGEFKFGYVEAEIYGVISKDKEETLLEFTFDGNDEMDPCQGRGWIKIKTDNPDIIEGELFFHGGDSSTFLARRAQ